MERHSAAHHLSCRGYGDLLFGLPLAVDTSKLKRSASLQRVVKCPVILYLGISLYPRCLKRSYQDMAQLSPVFPLCTWCRKAPYICAMVGGRKFERLKKHLKHWASDCPNRISIWSNWLYRSVLASLWISYPAIPRKPLAALRVYNFSDIETSLTLLMT